MIKRIILFIVIGVFLYSGYHIVQYVYDGYKSNQVNERIKQHYMMTEVVEQQLHSKQDEDFTETAHKLSEQYAMRFEQLREFNSDIVGWIKIANTDIDYPVVQSIDNDYYLHHNVERKSSVRGAIFMDYRNQNIENDLHTVIYGHHMKDGSMFGSLSKYKQASYYEEHDTIVLEGPDGETTWKIFSVYIYSPLDQFFEIEFSNKQQYSEYMQKIKAASRYETNVEVTSDDQLLTLVTCTYEVTDARFIIHAKRI